MPCSNGYVIPVLLVKEALRLSIYLARNATNHNERQVNHVLPSANIESPSQLSDGTKLWDILSKDSLPYNLTSRTDAFS